jgi:NAD-dependent dihydropyrimidine dehydrogenase PreA subunit
MALRKIIEIDQDLCNGCGNCIPNCPEGALQILDGKARLISDLFCDGLGACIGECPVGAINIIEREAEKYSETKVMENIVKQGTSVIGAHLKHLKDHNETALYNEAVNYLKDHNLAVPGQAEPDRQDSGKSSGRLPCGCPGSAVMDLRDTQEECTEDVVDSFSGGSEKKSGPATDEKSAKIQSLLRELIERRSSLKQWPVQIMLVPPTAPYLQGSNLLIAADCVPFAYPAFHEDFLAGKVVLVGCPKLDDTQYYLEKFTEIFRVNDIKSLTVVHMEVPCCFGLKSLVKQAMKNAGKYIDAKAVNIGIKGNIISEETL